MRVDLEASRRLTRRIRLAEERDDRALVAQLRAARRRIDARFDPRQALAGAVRYLTTARERFGRDDLAFVSYHMGIGNLEDVLRAYAAAPDEIAIRDVVRDGELSYARVFFDSGPLSHPRAWALLAQLGDSSRDYYWRVLAARDVMRLYRRDRERLEELAELHAAKASAEEVLHPADETESFDDPGELEDAWADGSIQALPPRPRRVHLRVSPHMGELAPQLDQEPRLYRGLRPAALALLVYLAGRVHEIGGGSLVVSSTVRDGEYQELLVGSNEQATPAYSLHTTGWAFDILRRYGSGAQRAGFQFMLERLQALGLIAWVREPGAIHVTVADEAQPLVRELLHRLASR
jgi:hypothetical protein